LRLIRNTPSVTRIDALAGTAGLSVVFRCRKRATAAAEIATPATPRTAANRFHGGVIQWTSGTKRSSAHMTSAAISMKTGGGIRGGDVTRLAPCKMKDPQRYAMA
jgi:hypothetical protein